jgi:hypothetical protein
VRRIRWCLPVVAAAVSFGGTGRLVIAAEPSKPTGGARFDFALFGNQRGAGEDRARFAGLVEAVNAAGVAFSVDDGGIGSAPADCRDDYDLETRDLFDGFDAPLVYTPGHSDWRDCTGGDGPQARLGSLRRIFFASNASAGRRTLELGRQRPYYPENARWHYGGVTFATLHVIGESDGLGAGAANSEATARQAAVHAWLEGTFDEAERAGSAGVVLIWQADPRFGQDVAAYNSLRGALRARTIGFGRPVVVVHGDGGYFRIDKPMVDDRGRRVANFTRVETFAAPDVEWVRAIVDPADPGLFTFRAENVPQATAGTVAKR